MAKYGDCSMMPNLDLPAPRGETNLIVSEAAATSTEAEMIIDGKGLAVLRAKAVFTPISHKSSAGLACDFALYL